MSVPKPGGVNVTKTLETNIKTSTAYHQLVGRNTCMLQYDDPQCCMQFEDACHGAESYRRAHVFKT